MGAAIMGRKCRLRPITAHYLPPRRAVGHLKGRNAVEDPRSGLTRRPTGWFASSLGVAAGLRSASDSPQGSGEHGT